METNDKLKTSTYFSLIALGLVTFIYSIIRTRLISNIPDTNALSIAGHIEWFDLFNEVLQTALIFPLYYIFNKRKDEFKSVIGKTFIISNSIYILFSILILIYCRIIVSNMTDKNISEVTTYLNLETIAFIINNFINFFMVILIFINKAKYFYLSCLLKTVFIIIGDLYLIPKFQVNGVAFSNILVNLLILIFCLFVLYKEDSRFSISNNEIKDIVKKSKKINEHPFKIKILKNNKLILSTVVVILRENNKKGVQFNQFEYEKENGKWEKKNTVNFGYQILF